MYREDVRYSEGGIAVAYCDRQLVYFDEWMDPSGGHRAKALERVRLVQLSGMASNESNLAGFGFSSWPSTPAQHGNA